MILLVPIVWPFLVIWLMFRFWRVTLLLMVLGLVGYVYAQSEFAGGLLFVGFLILAIRSMAVHQSRETRRESLRAQR